MRVKPTGLGNHPQPLRKQVIGYAIIAAVYGLVGWLIFGGGMR